MKRLRKICFCLLLAMASLGASGAEPKRVLFIHSFGRGFEPFQTVAGLLRTELASQMAELVEFFEVSLESARFTDLEQESPLLGYLRAEFARRRLDLIVPVGGPAVQFIQQHRQELFPDTPMLIVADQRLFNRANLTGNDAAILVANEPALAVETILQVLPQTTNVAVVIGNSALERFWATEIRRELTSFTNGVGFVWLNELPFSETLKRCAALPPGSAIFFPLLCVDAAGVPHLEERALSKLHNVANAPIFGIWTSQLGRGLLGGRMMDVEEYARNAADAAVRILHGESPGSINIPPQKAGAPQFDWRELRRWRISEAGLPTGSVVRFRQPGLWDRYWWLLCGGILFCAAEAALIVGLLVNRAKRRQGEAVATLIADLSSRFINLPAATVDREIEEAQRRVCESMRLDLSALWQWTDGPPRFFKMTHLYRPLGGPPISEPFDAQEVFPWCLKKLLAGKVIPVSSMDALPPEAGRDRESWLRFGIKSNLTFPLLIEGGRLIGGLSFNAVRKARSWPEEIVTRLELVAQIFANALARRRADQELRESEARLSLAAEAAAAGLWRLDIATNAFWLTNKTRDLFGFGADEVVTFDRFMSLVHPEDRELVRKTVQQVLESKGEVQVEYRVLQPDGRVQWMYSRGRVHCSGSGQANLMGVTVDVTPRKQAEEARRESEARLASAVKVAGLGFYDMGSVPGRVFVDERLRSMLGLTPQDNDRVQEFWIEHIHPEDRERVQELSRKVLGGELHEVTVEYRYQHPERGVLWFSHVSRAQEQDLAGRVVRRFGVIRDITEPKRAEEALRSFSARLISTQEEERSRLARELHDDITQRLARLAIDVGRSEAGTSDQSSDETGRTVREELIRLSEDVHALSYRLHPSILEDLGLAAALKAEAERFERQGSGAIEFRVQALPDSVSPDVALCLFRVAQEALRNAARHSGARAMKLSVRGVDEGLQLAVQDDGCGFDPTVQRDHPSLGLSSMGERVRLLGGELEIESAPGQGTTVLAWVPLRKAGG